MAAVQESQATLRRVQRVQFGILSPEEIKGENVCVFF